MGKKFSSEDKKALADLVNEEIGAYRRGEITRFSSNSELRAISGFSINTLWGVLTKYIPREDLKERQRFLQREVGTRNFREGIGLGAISPEKRSENSRRVRDLGLGIHAISHEQRVEISRNIGKRNAERKVGIHSFSRERRVEIGTRNFRNGIGLGAISHEQRVELGRRMGRINADSGIGIAALTPEQRSANGKKASFEQRSANAKRLRDLGMGIHAISPERRSEISRGVGRRTFELGLGIHGLSPERRREISSNAAEILRKSSYLVSGKSGEFYTQSQQEGAVALLLEKYLSNYSIIDGESFQIKNRGIRNGGIDFLVGGEFLEWHPIVLFGGRRGDIPKESVGKYNSIISRLSQEDKSRFKNKYSFILARAYQKERQKAVDSSDYAGSRLTLARDVNGLYEFIRGRVYGPMPAQEDFSRDFKYMVKQVKSKRVENKAA